MMHRPQTLMHPLQTMHQLQPVRFISSRDEAYSLDMMHRRFVCCKTSLNDACCYELDASFADMKRNPWF
jgi:hypothetical protein